MKNVEFKHVPPRTQDAFVNNSAPTAPAPQAQPLPRRRTLTCDISDAILKRLKMQCVMRDRLVGFGRVDSSEAKSHALQRERVGIICGAGCAESYEQERHAKKDTHG